jgi:hypothetical protein
VLDMVLQDEHKVPGSPSTGELVSQVSERVTQLMRDELELAKAEMVGKSKRAGLGIGLVGAGGVLALYGLACIVAAAVLGLSNAVAGWLAALVVGVAILAVAAAVAAAGRQQTTHAAPPVPTETVISLRADLDEVKESVRR